MTIGDRIEIKRLICCFQFHILGEAIIETNGNGFDSNDNNDGDNHSNNNNK